MNWEELLVRLAPTIVAAVAGFVAWREYRRKINEERRIARQAEQAKWWDILRWAMDKTDLGELDERKNGWKFVPVALLHLMRAESDDDELLEVLWGFVQDFDNLRKTAAASTNDDPEEVPNGAEEPELGAR